MRLHWRPIRPEFARVHSTLHVCRVAKNRPATGMLIKHNRVFGFLERAGFEADDVRPPLLAPRDEAGILQHLHVLRGAGEAHVEGARKLADRFRAEREAGEHSAPRRIGQRMERRVESIFNHVV